MGWLVLALAGGLRAELEWRQRRILLEPPAGAADASGEFEFINRGKAPVRITDVRSGCGCTAMTLDKDLFLPGEKGTIRAVYHVGGREGQQAVTVTVTTSEPEVRTYELTVEAVIKEFVVLSPRLVFWKIGDEPVKKVFQLTLLAGYRFLDATSTTSDFAVEVLDQGKGLVQLRAAPRDTWAKRNGAIKIRLAKENQTPVEVIAYVRVM